MKDNQGNDMSVKVISDAREEELLSLMRTIHRTVVLACADVGQKLTFCDDWAKCAPEDYKLLHGQMRSLISAKRKARWEEEVKGIRQGIQGVINTHMVKQRQEKAEYDAIPAQYRKHLAPFPASFPIAFSEIRPFFPEGTTPEHMVVRCKELGYTVSKGENGYSLKVPFAPAPIPAQNSAQSATKAA